MKTYLHVSMGISNICCFANVEAQCYPFLKHYPQHTILLGHSMMERPPKRFLLKLPLHPFWFGSHRLGFSGFQTSLQREGKRMDKGKHVSYSKYNSWLVIIGNCTTWYYLFNGDFKIKDNSFAQISLAQCPQDWLPMCLWLTGWLLEKCWLIWILFSLQLGNFPSQDVGYQRKTLN